MARHTHRRRKNYGILADVEPTATSERFYHACRQFFDEIDSMSEQAQVFSKRVWEGYYALEPLVLSTIIEAVEESSDMLESLNAGFPLFIEITSLNTYTENASRKEDEDDEEDSSWAPMWAPSQAGKMLVALSQILPRLGKIALLSGKDYAEELRSKTYGLSVFELEYLRDEGEIHVDVLGGVHEMLNEALVLIDKNMHRIR